MHAVVRRSLVAQEHLLRLTPPKEPFLKHAKRHSGLHGQDLEESVGSPEEFSSLFEFHSARLLPFPWLKNRGKPIEEHEELFEHPRMDPRSSHPVGKLHYGVSEILANCLANVSCGKKHCRIPKPFLHQSETRPQFRDRCQNVRELPLLRVTALP